MKKLLTAVILLTAFISESAVAQKKISEGTLTYEIIVDGEMEGMMAAMLPSEIIMKFKGTKSRTEMAMAMMENVAISDQKAPDAGFVLIDAMGSKYAMKVDAKMVEDQKKSMPEFEITESTETKEIAGFTCKKAIVKNKANNEESIIYYTSQLPYFENSLNAQFGGLKGMPLEFSSKIAGATITLRARTFEKVKLDDSLFNIPADYKVVTQEELMKEFGGAAE